MHRSSFLTSVRFLFCTFLNELMDYGLQRMCGVFRPDSLVRRANIKTAHTASLAVRFFAWLDAWLNLDSFRALLAAGFIGSTAYVVLATSECQGLCPANFYCPLGSSVARPCVHGTTAPGAGAKSDCTCAVLHAALC